MPKLPVGNEVSRDVAKEVSPLGLFVKRSCMVSKYSHLLHLILPLPLSWFSVMDLYLKHNTLLICAISLLPYYVKENMYILFVSEVSVMDL